MVVLLSGVAVEGGPPVVWCTGLARPSHRCWIPERVIRFVQRSAGDGDAHRPRGAGDDLLRLVEVGGVEVGHLGLGDLADLVTGDRGDLGLVRLARALLDAGGLEQHARGRRGLGDKGERAVLVDRDLDRDDVAALRLGRGVVRLAELHDVDAVLAERRTHGRRGGGRTGVDLELDDRGQPLPGGHDFFLCGMERPRCGPRPERSEGWGAPGSSQILENWLNDNSTGVSRPKMETSTCSFCCSALISLMVAGRVANGPSMTVTDSPTSKSTTAAGAAVVPVAASPPGARAARRAGAGPRDFTTSSGVRGDGGG